MWPSFFCMIVLGAHWVGSLSLVWRVTQMLDITKQRALCELNQSVVILRQCPPHARRVGAGPPLEFHDCCPRNTSLEQHRPDCYPLLVPLSKGRTNTLSPRARSAYWMKSPVSVRNGRPLVRGTGLPVIDCLCPCEKETQPFDQGCWRAH